MNAQSPLALKTAQTLVVYSPDDFSNCVKSVYSHLWIRLCIARLASMELFSHKARRRFSARMFAFSLASSIDVRRMHSKRGAAMRSDASSAIARTRKKTIHNEPVNAVHMCIKKVVER